MSNLHSSLDDDQLHVCKGHASAENNTHPVRNEKGAQVWERREILPAALDLVSSYVAPPTENYGDIYLLDGTSNHANWDGIAANSWARFDGTNWYGISPTEGAICHSQNDDFFFRYDGNSWVNNFKTSTNFETTTAGTGGYILKSPNGTRYIINVDNTGRLVVSVVV